MKPLRVFGWTDFDSRVDDRGRHQCRCIVAAHSMAEVARIVGVTSPARLFNLCETGNETEIDEAMSEPGTVFVRNLNDYKRTGPLFKGFCR